uniref:Uncharacterized protein n=1 Tax=Oryza brachyantha TaxID=4533 RepID=J3MHS9_ORYBR
PLLIFLTRAVQLPSSACCLLASDKSVHATCQSVIRHSSIPYIVFVMCFHKPT